MAQGSGEAAPSMDGISSSWNIGVIAASSATNQVQLSTTTLRRQC